MWVFRKGHHLKVGVYGGWDHNTSSSQKKGEAEKKDRSSKAEDGGLEPVLGHRKKLRSKQARETVAVGNVVGMVRYTGGRRRKDEAEGGVDRKRRSWKHQEMKGRGVGSLSQRSRG